MTKSRLHALMLFIVGLALGMGALLSLSKTRRGGREHAFAKAPKHGVHDSG